MHAESDNKAQRNRENQRRSRQRHKEYISELEARLAEHEKRGAQASQVLQKAAYKVSEENSKLKELLAHIAISKEELDAYLAGSLSAAQLKSAHVQRTTASEVQDTCVNGVEASLRNTAPCRMHVVPERNELHAHSTDSIESPRSASENLGTTPTLVRRGELHADSADSIEPPRAVSEILGTAPTLVQQGELHADSADSIEPPRAVSETLGTAPTLVQRDETDCEDAARIINSMRGGHPDDLRSELGCSVNGKCSVKNSTLFDLIDR